MISERIGRAPQRVILAARLRIHVTSNTVLAVDGIVMTT